MSSHADWASLPLEIRQMIIRQTLHNCLRHRSCGFLLRTLRSLLLINHAFSRDDLLPALRQVKQQLEQEDAAKESALRARHAISVKGHDEMAADDNYLRDRSLYYRRTNRHYHLISKAIGHTEQQITRPAQGGLCGSDGKVANEPEEVNEVKCRCFKGLYMGGVKAPSRVQGQYCWFRCSKMAKLKNLDPVWQS